MYKPNEAHIKLQQTQHGAVFRELEKDKLTCEQKPKIARLAPENMCETSNQDSRWWYIASKIAVIKFTIVS